MSENSRKTDEKLRQPDDLSETAIFEALTDTAELDRQDYMGETGILETLTDEPAKTERRPADKKEEPAGNDAIKEILLFLRDLAVCMAIVFVIVEFLARPIQVDGSSMYPTLTDGDIGIANLLGYRMGHTERFDIAIIHLEDQDKYLVKRVIGLPGETIWYSDGQLYVNGETVEEPFLDTDYAASYSGVFMEDMPAVTLADDEYFCMGDNRPRSSDSRVYGPFTSEMIIAKGAFIIWPITHFGLRTW